VLESSAWDFLGIFEFEVSDADDFVGSRLVGFDIHFFEGFDFVDGHEFGDVEAFDELVVGVVSGDLHEGTVFLVDPDDDGAVASVFAGVAEENFVTFLGFDGFGADDFGVFPVEEA